MSLPSINFLHLTVSEIQPGQTISRRPSTRPPARPDACPPDHPDTMGENNTPTAIKGCGVKTIENISKTVRDRAILSECLTRRVVQASWILAENEKL